MKSTASLTITDSQFQMWRAVFAMAHADGTVSGGEVEYMSEVLTDMPFSEEQVTVLKDDINNPKDIVAMFEAIPDPKHQAQFFEFAHKMVWADGAYTAHEQDILLKLQSAHIKSVNIDDLVGKVNLQLEDPKFKRPAAGEGKKSKSLIFSFRDQFMKSRFGGKSSNETSIRE